MAVIPMLTAALGAGVSAQTFDGPGSRAQGMSGAFVAVADDASAVYWNPGALASGAYFSLLIDRTESESEAPDATRAGDRSAWLLALSTPAVGLSYYRLREARFRPEDRPQNGLIRQELSRLDVLVTHHTGATLVQSVADGVAVGATVKLVRGTAWTGSAHHSEVAGMLNDAEVLGNASTKVDVDAGLQLTGSLARAGLTVRNLLDPEFETPDGERLGLKRQVRAGVAVLLTQEWTAALDYDLTRNRGPFGDVRTLAIGAEGRVARRAVARGGVQFNTAGGDRAPSASLGASYAVSGALLIDAHFSSGSDGAFRGWGVAGRVGF